MPGPRPDKVSIQTTRQLAWDTLTMAVHGGMPDSFWSTDQRILRAANVLGFDLEDLRLIAEEAAMEVDDSA